VQSAKLRGDEGAQNLDVNHLRVYRTDIPGNPTVVTTKEFVDLISRHDRRVYSS
jgi:hypothetical protein